MSQDMNNNLVIDEHPLDLRIHRVRPCLLLHDCLRKRQPPRSETSEDAPMDVHDDLIREEPMVLEEGKNGWYVALCFLFFSIFRTCIEIPDAEDQRKKLE
jgi:hypothetical protein